MVLCLPWRNKKRAPENQFDFVTDENHSKYLSDKRILWVLILFNWSPNKVYLLEQLVKSIRVRKRIRFCSSSRLPSPLDDNNVCGRLLCRKLCNFNDIQQLFPLGSKKIMRRLFRWYCLALRTAWKRDERLVTQPEIGNPSGGRFIAFSRFIGVVINGWRDWLLYKSSSQSDVTAEKSFRESRGICAYFHLIIASDPMLVTRCWLMRRERFLFSVKSC